MSTSTQLPSTEQPTEPEFWDFVHCSHCYLSFSTDDGHPAIPFWVTECGHVICNNHLNPDQSCSKCGAQGIQMRALQRDMEPPMSDWFRSLPYALDSVANTAKFQQATLYSLLEFCQNRCTNFLATIDRLRIERKSLKRELQAARQEIEHLQQVVHFNQEHGSQPVSKVNSNGKRPMTEFRQSNSVKTNSSPRSTMTPNRLTLPPGQNPMFSRQANGDQTQAQNITSYQDSNHISDGSSAHFIRQYAYNETQGQSGIHMRAHDTSMESSDQAQRSLMLPPPTPSNHRSKQFKPATNPHQIHQAQVDKRASSSRRDQPVTHGPGNMGPPAIPRGPHFQPRVQQAPSTQRITGALTHMHANTQDSRIPNRQSTSSNRFVPSSSHGQCVFSDPATKAGGSTRFTFDPSSRNPTPAPGANGRKGSQRTPFIPGSPAAFGRS